ncbi:hypothetical protein [Marinobacterium maritimum]|uniref:hypothetical protein n=1 Tax=Marinobacterium maritimum TaxID=500162 RepID=UPI0031E04F1B
MNFDLFPFLQNKKMIHHGYSEPGLASQKLTGLALSAIQAAKLFTLWQNIWLKNKEKC